MIQRTVIFSLLSLEIFTSEVAAQTFDAEVSRYTTICEVEKDRLTETDSFTLQINNRMGDIYTNISIPYSKSDNVSNISAWIETMDGAIVRKLKKSDIEDKSAISQSMYEDHYLKCFQLRHNEYPYKVFYTYKTIYHNSPVIAWWSPAFHSKIPTRIANLKVIAPKKFPLIKYFKDVDIFRTDSTEKNIIMEWQAKYDKPIKEEIFSQPKNVNSLVIVAPLNFHYGVDGYLKNWQSYGNWQYRLIEGLDILPDDEKVKVTSLINGVTDKKEIVKILYHYLQDHTRYINVSIGIGGLKPYPASYVSQNKYGDCKALSNYFMAVLKFVGIESFYANVYADEQPREIIQSMPVPQFNHIVLAVPLENETLWMENTDNTNPFAYMGTFTQNREALLVSKDQSKLVRIPALKMEDVEVLSKMEFDLKLSGGANVNITNSYKGKDFEVFNQLHSEFTDNEKDRIIKENRIIKEYMPFENYEVLNWDLKKMHRDTARIELSAKLNLYKLVKSLGDNEYYLTVYPCDLPDFTIPANRTLPVELPYPIYKVYSLNYNLPGGYQSKTKADTISLKSKFGNYEMILTPSHGKMQVTKRFQLYSGSYSLEQYPDFYKFIQSVKALDKKKLILQPATLN